MTSVPCKLLEHIIYRSIMIHLNSFDILVDAQHGFRPGRSCETQRINTVEHLARSVNDRNQTDLLILDFSKAFDKVAHKRLLLKLEYYGIRGSVLAWIKAWLIGRTQQVAVEGEFSEKSFLKSGVPQGTVLGPLCFLLFVNDIGNDWLPEILSYLLMTPCCILISCYVWLCTKTSANTLIAVVHLTFNGPLHVLCDVLR